LNRGCGNGGATYVAGARNFIAVPDAEGIMGLMTFL
jgi:hypothetical protein